MTRLGASLTALLALAGCSGSGSNDSLGAEATRSPLEIDGGVGTDSGIGTDGGAGTDGGDGGTYEPPAQPPFPWEAACPIAPTGPWVPRSVDWCIEPFEHLDGIRSDIVGHWTGTATTPWQAPYAVAVDFEANGHYSARCMDSNCIAFYYGTDRNTPLKQYRLLRASMVSQVSGEIDIAFDYGSQFGLPAWQGQLEEVEMDVDGDRLRFEFWRGNKEYGPVRFDLYRCP